METKDIKFYFTDNSNGEIGVYFKENTICKEIALKKLSCGNYSFELINIDIAPDDFLLKSFIYITPSLPDYHPGGEIVQIYSDEGLKTMLNISIKINELEFKDATDAIYVHVQYKEQSKIIGESFVSYFY